MLIWYKEEHNLTGTTQTYLVGGLEHFNFSNSVGRSSSSQLTNSIIFQGGRYTTNQFYMLQRVDASKLSQKVISMIWLKKNPPVRSTIISYHLSIYPSQKKILSNPLYIAYV